jgi:octaprenyl-diphosphate synthase
MNISSYQANLSFDGKHGLRSNRDKSNQFVASMITREMVSGITYDVTRRLGLSSSQAQTVQHAFSESNAHIYVGQYYDLNVFNLTSLGLFDDFSYYLKLYLEKCANLSGAFSEQCAFIGGALSGASESATAALRVLGKHFGTGLHIVNDIADFVPRQALATDSLRTGRDQCNDLREGKLTLPVVYALKFGNEAQSQFIISLIGHRPVSDDDALRVVQVLSETGALEFARGLAKKYWRTARTALSELPPSAKRSMLSVMLSQLRTNKYFHNLRGILYGQQH